MNPSIPSFLALAVFSGSALAQPSTVYYREEIVLVLASGRAFVNNTPQAAPQTQTFASPVAGQGQSTRTVQFTSDTAPCIDASARASQALSTASRANVHASLAQAFAVNGPANSFVPINFRGRFDVRNDSFLTSTPAQVHLSASTMAGAMTESVGLWVQCDGSALGPRCFGDNKLGGQTTDSSLQATLGAVVPMSFSGGGTAGSFSGVLMAATDAAGHGRGLFSLYAYASALGFSGYLGSSVSSAFIDPELRLDPAYLASHPAASLEMNPGVGSDIAAVPEASTLTTMLAGLALRAGLPARRRRA